MAKTVASEKVSRLDREFLENGSKKLTKLFAAIFFLFLLGVGNVWGAVGDAITSHTNIADATVYYFAGIGKNSTTYYSVLGSDEEGASIAGNANATKSNGTKYTFLIEGGYYYILSPNGYYVSPGSSNGKLNLSSTAQAVDVSTESSKIRISRTYNTTEWSFQKNTSTEAANFGGYKNTQSDLTLHVAGYRVIYDKNGATSGAVPSDATVYGDNQTATIKANTGTLVKAGYTFAGWNTAANGSGTDVSATGSATREITAGLRLYAKWTAAVVCADPSAPGNSSVSGTTATITEGTSGDYNIYYSTSSDAPAKATAALATISSGTSVGLTSLAYGTTYYYWAQKDCGSSTSNYVAGSPATFTTTVPAPTGVSAGSLSMTGATISITDANDVNSYDVYCSTSSTAPDANTTPSASGTSKSIAVTGLTSGETYYYWARAKGPDAKSDWVGGSTFTTLTLSSISVSTAPTKTKYLVGDNFDPTGLVITRTFSDKSSDTYTYADHTSDFSFSPATNAALTALNTSVTITYGGQTTSQAINVYTVTVNKVNMSSVAIADAGVSASCSGRTLSQSVGSTNYLFNSWNVSAGGVSVSDNSITGTPTGNVTINAKFHDPITVTQGTGTGTSTFTISAASVKYGTSVTVTCAAADGYKNSWTLTVTPNDGATYSSSGSTTSITISNITKDITVDLAYTECTDHGASSITGGTSDGDDYGPIHAYYKYSTSQILYTKSDLALARGKKGSIKSIYFQYSGEAAMASRTIKIYMANTTLSSLTTTKYVPYASFSEVYDGSFSCSSAGWYEIILDTPFEYDGVANLVVMVDDNSNSYEDEKNFKYHSATGAQIFKRQDSGDINPSSWTPTNAIDSRPNTKFCIEEDNMDEYTVNWYVNGSIERTQTGYEGETLTSIPTPVSGDCDGTKAFVGWYDDTYTHATDAPDFVEPEVIPGGDANYYAVFANVSGSDVYTEQTSDITSEGVYVLVSEYSSSYSYMPNTESSINPTLGTGITMTTSAGVTTLTNKVTRAMLWDFTEDDNYTNYFHVRPHGDATIGLGTASSTGANIRITADYKDDSFKFTTTDADQKWDIYNGHYLAVYSGSDWRNYSNNTTNQNGVFHIFKQTSSATYSNFATSCCTALGQPATLELEQKAYTIKATWTATSGGNETGYSVQLYDNSGGDKGSTIGDPISRTSSQLTYTFEGLTANHKYYVGVTPTYSGAGDYCATGKEKLVSVTTDQVYTVTYNGGGGSGTITDSKSPYEAGDEVTVKENTFTKSGYTFTAWSYSQEVTVTDGKFVMPSSNVVITATWTAKKNYYVDRMHGNCDGVNTVTINGVVYNCYLREGANYTRPDLSDNNGGANDCVTGHEHFIGWVASGNVSADGSYSSGTIYAGGSSGTATNDGTIYYAVWAEE